VTAPALRLVAPAPSFLRRLNPLAKVAAVVPAWIALLVTREATAPLLLLLLAVLLLLAGGRLHGRALVLLLIGVPIGILVVSVGSALWVDPGRASGTAVVGSADPLRLTARALRIGLTTALRLAALLTLGLIGGLTTSGPGLARALTAQLRIPYRFAYAAVAAYRFVPRAAAELTLIRQALRIRGVALGRGPMAAIRRMLAGIVPLLASSIRHADRVALAMESRAFGAHPRRTERVPPRWRTADTVFTVAGWAATAAVLVLVLRSP
jgi:energy-coupling factor transporter transmembrane protein EcfT